MQPCDLAFNGGKRVGDPLKFVGLGSLRVGIHGWACVPGGHSTGIGFSQPV
jgi:hypothetical protein